MNGLRNRATLCAMILLVLAALAGSGLASSSVGTTEVSLADASLTFWGEDIGDWSGYSVSPAGDVNNDGYDDILIGAPYAGTGGPKGEGKAYLILGRPRYEWWTADHVDLKEMDISFLGYGPGSMTARQNYTAGDVNGDGYDDFLVTTWKFQDQRGKVSLFLGSPRIRWGQNHPVGQADASFIGEDQLDRAGWYVTTAGDVNGDGLDDFLITAIGDEEGGGFRAGQTYLILGRAAADWGRDMDLGLADASFLGEAEGDASGRSAAAAGDVNGDGYDDFLIGAIYSDAGGVDAGQSYLFLGRQAADWGMDYPLSMADASFVGESAGDQIGRRVAGTGDVNGDGCADLLFGASYNHQVAPSSGKAYLVLGRQAADWGTHYPLSQADASFLGEAEGDQAGRRVSTAGDVNHDGLSDFLIGAPDSDRGGVDGGAVYLIYGRSGADWGTDVSLADADVIYVAESDSDNAGFDIGPAGDMDGDGKDDFLVGAWNADEHGTQTGQSYVMLSDQSPAPVDFIPDSPNGYVEEWHRYIGQYWDPDGWSDVSTVYLTLGRMPEDPKSLNVRVELADNSFFLLDSSGGGWLGPCWPGDLTILSNGYTELHCRRCSVSNDASESVRVAVRGRWIVSTGNPRVFHAYLRALDQAGNDSGYLDLGTWTLLP